MVAIGKSRGIRRRIAGDARRVQTDAPQLERRLFFAADILRYSTVASAYREYILRILFLRSASNEFEMQPTRSSLTSSLEPRHRSVRKPPLNRWRSTRPFPSGRACWPGMRAHLYKATGDGLNISLQAPGEPDPGCVLPCSAWPYSLVQP